MSFFSSARNRFSRSANNLTLKRSSSNLEVTHSCLDIQSMPPSPTGTVASTITTNTQYLSSSSNSSDSSSVFTVSTTSTYLTSRSITSLFRSSSLKLNYTGSSNGSGSRYTNDLLTPTIQSPAFPTSYYDSRRLDETVTEAFIIRVLGDNPVLLARLDEPLMSGLTDTTFLQWILSKCKKLFMILYEIGMAERIFGLVESSWDDHDLPINMADISKLGFEDGNVDKFWKTQYRFIVREMERGMHMNYLDEEIIPLEAVSGKTIVSGGVGGYNFARKSGALSSGNHNSNGKFLFPRTQLVVTRRSVNLGEGKECMTEEDFMNEVEFLKDLSHLHIVSVFATYTQSECGHILFSPSPSLSLRSFLSNPPPVYKMLPTEAKRRQLFDWMHCLSDAVAFLYSKGVTHKEICPKNILVEGGSVYFADIGTSRYFESQPSPGNNGSSNNSNYFNYEYCAPEVYRAHLGSINVFRRKSSVAALSGDNNNNPRSHRGGKSRRAKLLISRLPTEDTSSSDVFSLACIFVELLTFLQSKRTIEQFVAHRASRNRRGARGARGAIADQSYHANLEQVSSWITSLQKSAGVNDVGFLEACGVCGDMLFNKPCDRPDAYKVRDEFLKIAERECEPNVPHCGKKKQSDEESFESGSTWGMGMHNDGSLSHGISNVDRHSWS